MVAFLKGGNHGFLPEESNIIQELGLNLELRRWAPLLQIAEGVKQHVTENFSALAVGISLGEWRKNESDWEMP